MIVALCPEYRDTGAVAFDAAWLDCTDFYTSKSQIVAALYFDLVRGSKQVRVEAHRLAFA